MRVEECIVLDDQQWAVGVERGSIVISQENNNLGISDQISGRSILK